MATRIELATMVCALLNSTRKGEGWVVQNNDDYRQQTNVVSTTKRIAVEIRGARAARNGDQRVKVSARYLDALHLHAPRYETRGGMVRGWKPKTLLLRRDPTVLALAVLGYVTTTAIAGLEAAVAAQGEAQRVRAAEEAARAACEAYTDVLAREMLAVAPTGSRLRTRGWSDPRGNGVDVVHGRVVINERTGNDGAWRHDCYVHLDGLTSAQALAIVKALREESESRLAAAQAS